jgi:hypothetical protein
MKRNIYKNIRGFYKLLSKIDKYNLIIKNNARIINIGKFKHKIY